MKVEVKNKPTFEPIELIIVIESKDELLSLVKRMRLFTAQVNSSDSNFPDTEEELRNLYSELKDLWVARKS